MSFTVILIIGLALIVILLVVGVVITMKSGRRILEERLEKQEDRTDSVNPRLAGDSSTDAPLPDGKVKKKRKER